MINRLQSDSSAGFKLLLTLATACLVAANLFIFAPLTIYLGNVEEFNAPLTGMLSNYIPPFVVFVLAMALIGFILPALILRRLLSVLAALSLLLWLQGNLLVWDYGVLDGKAIDWTHDAWRGWVDATIWVALLAVALVFASRVAKPLFVAAVVMAVVQIAGATISIAQQPGAVLTASNGQSQDNLSDMVFRFSTSRNVLHIVMDGFQSDIFEEIINEGEPGKRMRDALDGFVFFKENMGAFPYTHMSVPALLTGQTYRNQITRKEFFEQTLDRKTILRSALEAGFEVDVAAGSSLSTYKRSGYTNAYAISSHEHILPKDYAFSDSARLLDVTLFRLAPHFTKRYVYNDQLWFLQRLFSNKIFAHLEFFSHNAFLQRMRARMTVDRATPVYKMFHLMLSHTPFVANEECGYAGGTLQVNRHWVKVQERCSFAEIIRLLGKLKSLGIYSETTIILMGDHGAWIPPNGLTGEDHLGRDFAVVRPHPITVAMAMPVMLIKPPGSTGPMRVSMAPSWIGDVPQTISSLLGLKTTFTGQSMLDLDEFAARERRHYSYAYARSEWDAAYLAPIYEYIVTGRVLDGSAWRRGTTFLPPDSAEMEK